MNERCVTLALKVLQGDFAQITRSFALEQLEQIEVARRLHDEIRGRSIHDGPGLATLLAGSVERFQAEGSLK